MSLHPGLAKCIENAWRLLKPRDNLTVTEWADRKRFIRRGKYYSSTAPYQQEPMRCATDRTVGEIVLITAAQMGKTTVVENISGFSIDHDPKLILVVQPTLDAAKSWSTDRLKTMAEDSFPDRFEKARARDSRNTMLFKSFPGGDIAIVGSNAPAGLASRDRNLVILDETCRYEDSAGAEGDIEQLAIKRTESHPDALVVRTSTPTVSRRMLSPDGQPVILPSRIFRAFNDTDKRLWFCKCPKCGFDQTLKWANVKWEEGKPETAHYVCEGCKEALSDSDRHKMAMGGEWRATAPFKGKAGFWLNALASPFPPHRGYVSRLHELAAKFIAAKHDKEKLKAFINTDLAEDFLDYGSTPDTKGLFDRREPMDPQALPDGILCLTAGVDVQGDRFEMQLCGWGEGEECWIIEHRVIPGDPKKPDVWRDLDSELERRRKTKSGHDLAIIQCTIIDSGDGKTQKEVYRYVIPRQRKKVFASKGEGQIGHPLINQTPPTKFAKRREPVWLVHIGVDTAKDMIFDRCAMTEIGPKYVHFSTALSAEWFNQLAAEEKKDVTISGRMETRWTQVRARNEALDCFVMNLAAVTLIRPQWDVLKAARKPADPEPEPEPERPNTWTPSQPPKPAAPSPKPGRPPRAPRVSKFTNWRG